MDSSPPAALYSSLLLDHDSMIHLVLFFTRGVSLQSWKDAGILERELALYRRLMGRGVRVSLVTYGDGSERKFAERIPGISILCNDRRLPQAVYAFFLPLLHGAALNGATVFKTNQLDGADVAIRAAVYWRKPLIARCGYMRSFILEKELGASSPTARLMRRQEDRAFETARKIVVTTAALRDDVVTRVPTAEEKTVVIPNYVDTSLFQPVDRDETSGGILFVGRLSPEKNLRALLDAIRPLDVNLTIVGEGSLRTALEERSADMASRIRWRGIVPNAELPKHMDKAALYVQPSLYEGHPKTLIEAMACGLPVIGGDSPGIRDLIRHGETGWLCGTDPAGIREAIQTLMSRPDLRKQLGENARRHALDHFSLDRVVDLELSVLSEAAASGTTSAQISPHRNS